LAVGKGEKKGKNEVKAEEYWGLLRCRHQPYLSEECCESGLPWWSCSCCDFDGVGLDGIGSGLLAHGFLYLSDCNSFFLPYPGRSIFSL